MKINNGKWDFSNVQMSSPDFAGHYQLGMTDAGRIAAFSTKKQAVEFARKFRWPVKYVSRGFNRFFSFYFVGQMISPEEYWILQQNGEVRKVAVAN